MITADPKTPLGRICTEVDRLEPGMMFNISLRDIGKVGSYHHNGVEFTPMDRVLENVVGSCATHSYHVNWDRGWVTFVRHMESDLRPRYKSPDRR